MKSASTLSAIVLTITFIAAPATAQIRDAQRAATQTPAAQPAAAQGGAAEAGAETVVIQRESLKLIDPQHYQVPLQLTPSKFVTVVAPRDGVIVNLPVKSGDTLNSQAVVFRMDDSAEQLRLKRAQAELAVQQLKLAQAKKQGGDAVALAEAELKVAEVDLELAEYAVSQTQVKIEYDSQIFRTHVIEREFVTAKQPILEIGDPSTMVVEIPVDREAVKTGDRVKITVEGQEVEAEVARILPAAPEFEPLRDLYNSLASAEVTIGNRAGDLQAGQAVYVSLIPRQYVTEVPNAAIAAAEQEGQRKVQVIRKNVVRDIAVSVLSPVGSERSYVSGPFAAEDELIVTSTEELADGTQVTQEPGAVSASATGTGGVRPAGRNVGGGTGTPSKAGGF